MRNLILTQIQQIVNILDMFDIESFSGERLRSARKHKKLSQERLSELITAAG